MGVICKIHLAPANSQALGFWISWHFQADSEETHILQYRNLVLMLTVMWILMARIEVQGHFTG